MKYYLIAGEASGDLHAAHLITAITARDGDAQFRFFGGDAMTEAAGKRGTRVRHFRELAYMGFVPVLLHLRTILRNMKLCQQDIMEWKPQAVIFVDYAGFNLSIAKKLRKQPGCPRLIYYISPKIWAWKEYRIKNFKRDIDDMLSILPFEKDFFEGKHHYPIHYVGNPTADEVRQFKASYKETKAEFCQRLGLDETRPIVALLPGSRQQEIKDNLTAMLKAADKLAAANCNSAEQQTAALRQTAALQFVVAGAPGVSPDYYTPYLGGTDSKILFGETYRILFHADAAMVTSGTATLETALFRVPQVVCYKTPVPKLCRWGFDHILKVDYISLVNLIANREVVRELFADHFSVENIAHELQQILPGGKGREQMLKDYDDVAARLGNDCAPENAADIILKQLTGQQNK